jgi:hypothetical protein
MPFPAAANFTETREDARTSSVEGHTDATSTPSPVRNATTRSDAQ